MIRWKAIPGFPRYLVSSEGEVKRVGAGFLKLGGGWCGYPSVCLYNGTRASGRTVSVAHLVLKTFVGECPEGMECCHEDGNRLNSRLTNLRWDTHQSNVLDAIRHGTHVSNSGAKNGRAKLSNDEALQLYDRSHAGESIRKLGQEYGLHPEYVRLVKKGIYWSHLYELVI